MFKNFKNIKISYNVYFNFLIAPNTLDDFLGYEEENEDIDLD